VVFLETLLGAWGETMAPLIITEITRNKNACQNYTERTQKRIITQCKALLVLAACFAMEIADIQLIKVKFFIHGLKVPDLF
jgi:hypothetical protein